VATDRVLTTAEVAQRLGVSTDEIRHWITSGELAAVNVALRRGGRPRWRIATDDLAAFLSSRSATPKPIVRYRRQAPSVIEFY
jgi:excisionase family DNA binding protein